MEPLFYISQFKQFYNQCFQDLARQYDLQMIDIHLLLFVCNNPSRNTARDAVALRGLSKSNVSTALCKLRERGLIRLQTDAENRRLQRIFLLPAGEQIAKTLQMRQREGFEQLFSGFSGDDLSRLRSYMTQITDNIASAISDKTRKDTPL